MERCLLNFFRAVMASLHLATPGFRAQSHNADAYASNSWVEQSCKNTILEIQFQGGKFGRIIHPCFHVTGRKLDLLTGVSF